MSDIVVRGLIPDELRHSARLWAGCFAGAVADTDYQAKLARAGFVDIEIQPTRIFTTDEAHEFLTSEGLDADGLAAQVGGKVMSAFVRARKP